MNDQIRNQKTVKQLCRMMIYAKRAERSKRRGFERERAVRDLRRCNIFYKRQLAIDAQQLRSLVIYMRKNKQRRLSV